MEPWRSQTGGFFFKNITGICEIFSLTIVIFWSLFIGTGFGLRLHQPKLILSRKYENCKLNLEFA